MTQCLRYEISDIIGVGAIIEKKTLLSVRLLFIRIISMPSVQPVCYVTVRSLEVSVPSW